MTVVVTIAHACGHSEERDLSHKLPEDRNGFAKWLASIDCLSCYRAKNDKPLTEAEKRRWGAKQRAAERQEAEEDQERYNLPPLQGSEKQENWAVRIRFDKIRDAYVDMVEEGGLEEEAFDTNFVQPVRMIQSAKWWIENKDLHHAELPEKVEALKLAGTDALNENPF